MMWITSAFLCLFLVGLATPERRYDGYHVVNVKPVTEENLVFLKQMEDAYAKEASFWSEPVAVGRDVMIAVDEANCNEFETQLRGAGLQFSMLTDDLQSLIDKEHQQTYFRAGPINLNQFNTHAQIDQWLSSLDRSCQRCSVFSIGQSFEGRDMKVIKVHTGDDDKPAIWIDAGIHAREWIAPSTALFIINELAGSPDLSSAARQLLDDFDFYILPSANPDGYDYSWTEDRLWRKTRQPTSDPGCVGVDPNRNWDFHWMGPGASGYPCADDYAGPEPFSEPETKALSTYLLANKEKFVVYLTFHSYGQWWFTPWGYTSELPDDYDDLMRVANKSTNTIHDITGNRYTAGSPTNLLYVAAGGSEDWAKGVAGIPFTYTVELSTGFGFVPPPELIEPQGKEMWIGLRSTVEEVKRILMERSDKPTHRRMAGLARQATQRPTWRPTNRPTNRPTIQPTMHPTPQPTHKPTAHPTARPTTQPTQRPTYRPTKRPTTSKWWEW